MTWEQELEDELRLLGWEPPRLREQESVCRFLFRPSFDQMSCLSFRFGLQNEAEFLVLDPSLPDPRFRGDILTMTDAQATRIAEIAALLADLDDCELAARDGIVIDCELHQVTESHHILLTSPTALDCPQHHAMLTEAIALARQIFPDFEADLSRIGRYL